MILIVIDIMHLGQTLFIIIYHTFTKFDMVNLGEIRSNLLLSRLHKSKSGLTNLKKGINIIFLLLL